MGREQHGQSQRKAENTPMNTNDIQWNMFLVTGKHMIWAMGPAGQCSRSYPITLATIELGALDPGGCEMSPWRHRMNILMTSSPTTIQRQCGLQLNNHDWTYTGLTGQELLPTFQNTKVSHSMGCFHLFHHREKHKRQVPLGKNQGLVWHSI